MILGFTIGLPVVAAVATSDRWNHFIRCPYCEHIHSHGGFGPSSPFGAVDDARFRHCHNVTDDAVRYGMTRVIGDVVPDYYVLKEVPGVATERHPGPGEGDYFVREITYDYHGIASMRQDIADAVTAYESRWEGVHLPRGGRMHPAQLAFRRGEIPWLSAYVPPSSSALFPMPPRQRCAVYLHYDADGVLLYVGITDSLAVRGKRHAAQSTWAQFAVRGEHVWCDDRRAAERKEVELIRTLRPLFNDKHSSSDRNERLVAYLAGKGRYDLLTPAITRG